MDELWALVAYARAVPLTCPEHLPDWAMQILVCIPTVLAASAVVRQSKWVAALAQMSTLQSHQELDHQLCDGPLTDKAEELAENALLLDKQWYFFGVVNAGLTSFIIGAYPTYYFLYFTPKVLSLVFLRWWTFVRKKQHYLLWDFCYWANFLCVLYVWVWPQSPRVFRVAFLCANGPLAWSVLCFNHALIFHSYPHLTSVIVHTSPLVLTYGIRWFPSDRFVVCEAEEVPLPACDDVPFSGFIADAMGYFYLWWMVIYYFWIFLVLGSYLEKQGYQTLWDRVLTMGGLGRFLTVLLEKWPKRAVQGVYLLIHCLFSLVVMSFAYLLWFSQKAHFAFMLTIALATVKNGADFYFDALFRQTYAPLRVAWQGVDRKVASASPALQELQGVGLTAPPHVP